MINYLHMSDTAKRMSHPARELVVSLAKQGRFDLAWFAPRAGFRDVDDWSASHTMIRYLEKKMCS